MDSVLLCITEVICGKSESQSRDVHKIPYESRAYDYFEGSVLQMYSQFLERWLKVKYLPGNTVNCHLSGWISIDISGCMHISAPPSAKVLVTDGRHDNISINAFLICLGTNVYGIGHDAVDGTGIPMSVPCYCH